MANFIRNRKLKNNTEKWYSSTWRFWPGCLVIHSSIYEAGWDSLKTDNCNRTFRQNVASKFTPKTTNNKPNKRVDLTIKEKQVEVVKIPPPILPRLSKETLEKLKFFKKNYTKSKENANLKDRWSYAQVFAPKIKLKEFSNLLAKKIKNIHNAINSFGKVKYRINITTKVS